MDSREIGKSRTKQFGSFGKLSTSILSLPESLIVVSSVPEDLTSLNFLTIRCHASRWNNQRMGQLYRISQLSDSILGDSAEFGSPTLPILVPLSQCTTATLPLLLGKYYLMYLVRTLPSVDRPYLTLPANTTTTTPPPTLPQPTRQALQFPRRPWADTHTSNKKDEDRGTSTQPTYFERGGSTS